MAEKREFVCIICPRGCHLTVDENNNVSGYSCPRGLKYALEEITCPKRTITTSIRVANREDMLVSVKTSDSVPKADMFKVMDEINKLKINAPTHIGEVVVKDICHLGVDLIITKEIE